MRATEIIRGVLDLIDQLECNQPAERNQMYDNSPDPIIAGIDSVTKNAGGGLNGPKNPADLRSNSVSMFPNYQAKG
jgi:hypothetical protein